MGCRFPLFIRPDEPGQERLPREVGHAFEQGHQLGERHRRQAGEPLQEREIGAARRGHWAAPGSGAGPGGSGRGGRWRGGAGGRGWTGGWGGGGGCGGGPGGGRGGGAPGRARARGGGGVTAAPRSAPPPAPPMVRKNDVSEVAEPSML